VHVAPVHVPRLAAVAPVDVDTDARDDAVVLVVDDVVGDAPGFLSFLRAVLPAGPLLHQRQRGQRRRAAGRSRSRSERAPAPAGRVDSDSGGSGESDYYRESESDDTKGEGSGGETSGGGGGGAGGGGGPFMWRADGLGAAEGYKPRKSLFADPKKQRYKSHTLHHHRGSRNQAANYNSMGTLLLSIIHSIIIIIIIIIPYYSLYISTLVYSLR
jgi:hypothetical protein